MDPYRTKRGNAAIDAKSSLNRNTFLHVAGLVPGGVGDFTRRLTRRLGRRASRSSGVKSLRTRVVRILSRMGLHLRRLGPGTVVVSRHSTLHTTKIGPHTGIVSARDGRHPSTVLGLGPVAAPGAAQVHSLGRGAALVQQPEAARAHVFDIHKALYKRMTIEHIADGLRTYGVNCVLDVGANTGQYARDLRQAGYEGHIVSFEPVPEMFERLERAAAGDPKWTVHHCALGREDGTVEMNVVAGSMSSILPPSEFGNYRYKRFRNISTVDVPLRRLDQILDEVLPTEPADPRVYLKMDTQGYDIEVFTGLGQRVRDVVGMQSEVALLQIYEGMPRLPEAVEVFEAAGFEITGMFPVTRETHTGRVLEFDCVLARADELPNE